MPDTVAQEAPVVVASVLPELQTPFFQVGEYLRSGDVQERAGVQFRGEMPHGAKTGGSSAAQKTKQKCLRLVVCMVPQGDPPRPVSPGKLPEPLVARGTPRILQRELPVAAELEDVDAFHFEGAPEAFRQLPDKGGVAVRVRAAQLVIHVGYDNVQFQVPQGDQDIQKGHGIRSA